MLRPIKHLDPRPGEAVAAPRARVLSATVIRRVDRWHVCLNIEAPAFHPGRRHQHRSQDEGRRFVGIDRGLTVFAVVADSDGVEVCRFAAPRPLARRQRRLRRRARGLGRT
jgi:putative transposase